MARTRKTVSEMRAALAEIRRAGISLFAYARESGIPYQTVVSWRRRVALEDKSAIPSPPTRFVEVRRVRKTRSLPVAAAFDVELRNGRRVRVPAVFDESALRRLLSVLDPC